MSYSLQYNTSSQLRLLPSVVEDIVQNYLWGTLQDWKRKLNIVQQLPTSGFSGLCDVKTYRSYSNIVESEDCMYCSVCGEKKLWFALSFYNSFCVECETRRAS
jgi:hypothetical protein